MKVNERVKQLDYYIDKEILSISESIEEDGDGYDVIEGLSQIKKKQIVTLFVRGRVSNSFKYSKWFEPDKVLTLYDEYTKKIRKSYDKIHRRIMREKKEEMKKMLKHKRLIK